jgi:protein TonB
MDDAEPADKRVQHHDRESYLVHQVLGALVRPEPYSARRLDFILSRVRRTVGGLDLGCLSISPAGMEVPRIQTFCVDVDGNLQAILGEGPFQIDRTNFAPYRNTKVPTDITISYRGKTAIKAHVTALTALTPSETAVAADPNDAPIVPGQVLARVSASYPIAARLSGASGLVILTVLVTKEGKTAGVDVVSSPSSALSKAAIEAVKKWTYSAYKRNGEPVLAEETVTVDFSLVGN